MFFREDIPKDVRVVAETLINAGHDAYLVGGCVRDLILGKRPKDWDVTTDAHPERIVALFPDSYANNEYGTIGVKTESEDPTLKVIEVTPYRAEEGYSDARRPDSVKFGVSLEEDLSRRDFTVNAIAVHIQDLHIIDPYNGREDLEKKKIVAVRDAKERFMEDALRMLRAVRFSVQLGFIIDTDTMSAIAQCADNLKNISKERIRDEFTHIINSPEPMRGIVFLEKLGLLKYVMPELEGAIGVGQNKAHSFDVYEHLLRSLQHAADKNFTFHVRMAALLHDIGKPESRRFSKEKNEWTFHGHEVVSARLAKKILSDLKYPRADIDAVASLVRWHMFFSDPAEITLSAVRRTVRNVGEDHIEDLLNMRVCDRIGTGRPKEQPFRFRMYKSFVDEALRDPISPKMLKIDGARIMDITGEKPGPRIGNILSALLEEALEDGTKNSVEYMESRAQELSKLDSKELVSLGEKGRERKESEEEREIKELRKKHKVG